MPKYIAGVSAVRASGRSIVQSANGGSRRSDRNGVPNQSPSGGRGVPSDVGVVDMESPSGRAQLVQYPGGLCRGYGLREAQQDAVDGAVTATAKFRGQAIDL